MSIIHSFKFFRNYNSSIDSFLSTVWNHYEGEGRSCWAGVVGSLKILGNPAQLVRNLSGNNQLSVEGGKKTVEKKKNIFARGLKG